MGQKQPRMDMFIEFNLKDLKTFNFNLIIDEQEVTKIEVPCTHHPASPSGGILHNMVHCQNQETGLPWWRSG